MSTVSVLITASLLASQYPDAMDHLRAGDVVPQVGLLLDRSCSMASGHTNTSCTWYAAKYNGGNKSLNKKDMMKAVLVGCKSDSDGILDLWSDRVNFSIFEFGSSVNKTTAFDSPLGDLELGVLGIPASGSTYMTRGLRDHAKYFQDYFTTGNTLECRPNFLVMLSDGNPNGGAATFDYECSASPESRYVASNKPWLGSDYLFQHDDILCGVPGDQAIRTYTIGFGAPGTFSPSNLQNIATYGGGEYFYASDAEQLSVAFESIIGAIVAKSALFFAPIAIQTGSMFAENYAFAASFKPQAGGPWRGTVKKYCIAPPLVADGSYDKGVDTCLFVASSDGRDLETNPNAMDLWTGTRSLVADRGGAGEVLFDTLGASAGQPPEKPYHGRRNILTYRAGDNDYTKVDYDHWSSEDAWTNGCDYYRLMNYLHGYTYDANCSNGDPIAVDQWPLGDAVGAAPQLLKYGACEDDDGVPIAGNCYLVAAMNDGMVHFFETATGAETTALIPADIWQPSDRVHSILRDIMSQPSPTFTHRYYVDGGMRLFHEDDNADGIIQSTEVARLVFSLGRGGRVAYMMPISTLPGGKLTAANNPVYPLQPEDDTSFEDLEDQWAAPWLGLAPFDGQSKRVAIFGSGHIPELDLSEEETVVAVGGGAPPPVLIDLDDKKQVSCKGSGNFADFNGLHQSKWCDSMWYSNCNGKNKSCYDAAGPPLDVSTAPLTFNDGKNHAAALRLYFHKFDLNDGDVLRIEDGAGNLIGAYTRTSLKKKWTPWVYDDEIVLRLITDGVDTKNRGYAINKVEWVPGAPLIVPPAVAVPIGPILPEEEIELGVDRHPSLYVVDLDVWNHVAKPKAFVETTRDDSMLLRFTNDCEGRAEGRCFDQEDFEDLQHMICPISAEVSVYTENQHVKAVYVGDECAQIWKVWTDDFGKNWNARRLINLNGGKTAVDKDHRKIQRRIDLALSSCQGQRSVALYFGTGDVQRPADKDLLEDAAVTDGRDLIGVLYDTPKLPSGLTEGDLENVTAIPVVDPADLLLHDKHGWAIRLADNERMLRDPLVFDRVAYYKSFEPTTEALECGGGSGVDRVYAIDSCTAQAVDDKDGDGDRAIGEREVWIGQTEIGGGLFFFTPKDSPVLVSHADLGKRQKAGLNARKRSRPGLFFWRER